MQGLRCRPICLLDWSTYRRHGRRRGQQFQLHGGIASEQGVVDDEDVPAFRTYQRRDRIPDDGRTQKQRELVPM